MTLNPVWVLVGFVIGVALTPLLWPFAERFLNWWYAKWSKP